MPSKTKKTRWTFMDRHHKAVAEAIQDILGKEKWNKTHSDEQLSALVMDRGLLASANVVRDVRIKNGIPNAEERKIQLFAEQHKSKGRR